MPFTKGQPEDLSNLRDMAYGWGKIVSRRAFGDEGPGLDIDFDSIESLAVDIGQAVIKGAIEETLKTQLKILGDCQPCPQCARACPLDTESRTIQVRGGTIQYAEPRCHCPACRRDFFPLRPSLRLDSHNFSPTILGKILRAAARSTSFDDAAESLADEAEVDISGRQVGRIAHEVGEQLQQNRDRRVDEFQNKQATPEAPVVPRLAVVYVDGGRLHTRSEEPGKGPGVHDAAWREDKVANLVTMNTATHDADPHPDLPECFTQKKEVVELVQGIAGQGSLADVVEGCDKDPPVLAVFVPAEEDAGPIGQRHATTGAIENKPKRSWPPEPLVRTCQATLESSDEFGPMVAAEAHQRNFFAAQLRAFLGDGSSWIWTLLRTYFPTFEPIVDFVHVLTYVYLAAKAVGGSATVVWNRYLDWATACWQGRVATVLEELRVIHEAMPLPENPKELKPTDPYEVIRVTIGYLTNNEARMDYPRYRRAGLPTCSGLVESLVKQFNRRVKGTEKFWNPSQAETILQLRAAFLCDDERLTKHMKTRPISAYRTYKTTRKRKAG